MNLRNLGGIKYNDNRIEYLPPQFVRILNRQTTGQRVYNDGQNVHNHNIQQGINKSIEYLTSFKPIVTNVQQTIVDLNLAPHIRELLFTYIANNEVHSIYNITYKELLTSVLSLILQHEAKDELITILQNEVNESQGKCFTGRMSRLVNVLNGFDPNIVITISENEQIANVLSQLRKKYVNDDEFTVKAKHELSERGYDEAKINEWLDIL